MTTKTLLKCELCGGELVEVDDNKLKCAYCSGGYLLIRDKTVNIGPIDISVRSGEIDNKALQSISAELAIVRMTKEIGELTNKLYIAIDEAVSSDKTGVRKALFWSDLLEYDEASEVVLFRENAREYFSMLTPEGIEMVRTAYLKQAMIKTKKVKRTSTLLADLRDMSSELYRVRAKRKELVASVRGGE